MWLYANACAISLECNLSPATTKKMATAAETTKSKKTREPNWTGFQDAVLRDHVSKQYRVLYGDLSSTIGPKDRVDRWAAIAKKVNGGGGPIRTIASCKYRWKNFKQTAVKDVRAFGNSAKQTGLYLECIIYAYHSVTYHTVVKRTP